MKITLTTALAATLFCAAASMPLSLLSATYYVATPSNGGNDATGDGKLILGDATHPAYVWNKAYGDYTNRIWATVSAPGGFVSTTSSSAATRRASRTRSS